MNVLIVDDALFMRNLLRGIFERADFAVVGEAGDGSEAVEKYRTLRPELVMMDIVMPELDGFQTYKMLKELQIDMPVLMMTAFSDERVMQSALSEGVCEIVSKPFNIDTVIATLQELGSRQDIVIIDENGNRIAATSAAVKEQDDIATSGFSDYEEKEKTTH